MQIANLISMAIGKKLGNAWRQGRVAGSAGLWHVLCVPALLLFFSSARAQSLSATEYQVKAAFLYNFAKFVEWPASRFSSESAPLQICVFGSDPFGKGLREITHDKLVNGRKIEVNDVSDPQQTRSCHILFITSAEKAQVRQILENLRGSNILTVGETKDFIEQGGMINFVLENDRVLFEVSRKAADQAGLKISSKLLSVAKSVTL